MATGGVVVALLAAAATPASAREPFRNVLPAGQGETVDAAELGAYQASGQPPATFLSQNGLYTGLVGAAPKLQPRDLDRYFPAWGGTRPDDLAFQVQRGDETVGVVLLRADDADPTVARVVLDYVTPRYRDFSPGEFVWRRWPRLRDRGFRRVETPPGMVSPYYDRLDVGFRREGERYVLDLSD